MSKITFPSARLKIERANQHISYLEEALARFVAENRNRMVRKLNPDTGEQTIGYGMGADPTDIPLIIGDIAHNLRAALDHVAGAIRRAAGKSDKDGHFPMSAKQEAFEQSVSTQIEPFSPFIATALLANINMDDARNYPLTGINQLDNIDKHRRLSVAITSTMVTAKGVNVGDFRIGTLDAHPAIKMIVAGKGVPIEFDQEFQPASTIVFGRGEPFESQSDYPNAHASF